jgi:RsiW-degrading membrane proteinase PrsW (M82 family)
VVLFSILGAAVAPGFALLAYFYLKDRYDTEPFPKVLKLFLMGAVTVVLAVVLQHGLYISGDSHPFIFSFGVSAGIEELLKWTVLMAFIYNHSVFDEPYDGIVYAVAVSLGFATLENIMFAFQQQSFSALLYRAFLPVSGHALFGVFMGYYLGKAKFTNQKWKYIAYSLCLPVLLHGLFDYIILTTNDYWAWFIFPLMLWLWIRSLRKVQSANSRSPFRWLKRDEEIKLEEIRP